MADHLRERIASNNLKFRDANQRIRSRTDELGADMDRIPFLCECPVEGCAEILHLTREEYADIREHPDRFMTAVGHEAAEAPLGKVLARTDGYVVVEKHIE